MLIIEQKSSKSSQLIPDEFKINRDTFGRNDNDGNRIEKLRNWLNSGSPFPAINGE
jgi:hypothetical protein